ncbi:MAG: asparagine--tRNA ligase, partial [bacterium]
AGEMFNVTTLDLKNIKQNDKGEIDYTEDFFGKKAGLTVSGQLEAESMALAFNRVYTFGPTFRAENSHTARHASEFWMIEPEITFAGLLEDMALAEEMMKYLINYVLRELPEEMEFFNKFIDNGLLERLNKVKDAKFKHLTYTEAIEILEKSGKKFEYRVEWGIDLQTEHERYLTDEVVGGPVFITDYPKEIKAFYMRQNDDGKTVAAMDLLMPGVGEIIGGSQREERLEILEARIAELKLPKENYWWYLDLRKYGGVRHAGFGLGFERALMYLSGMQNIRDVIPFPRTPKNAEF